MNSLFESSKPFHVLSLLCGIWDPSLHGEPTHGHSQGGSGGSDKPPFNRRRSAFTHSNRMHPPWDPRMTTPSLIAQLLNSQNVQPLT